MTEDVVDTLVRIQWDTNVFVRSLVTGSEQLEDFLFKLYKQHENKIIRFVNPKAVQSEFYGILAAGRVQIGGKSRVFTHEEIVAFMEIVPDFFRLDDFIPSLQYLDWKPLQGKDYKQTWNHVLQKEYGWDDFGKSCIERRLRYDVEALGIDGDTYDWPIMASAIQSGVDLLVTANINDFVDPLGRIKVMDAYKAYRFHYLGLHEPTFPR